MDGRTDGQKDGRMKSARDRLRQTNRNRLGVCFILSVHCYPFPSWINTPIPGRLRMVRRRLRPTDPAAASALRKTNNGVLLPREASHPPRPRLHRRQVAPHLRHRRHLRPTLRSELFTLHPHHIPLVRNISLVFIRVLTVAL